MRTRRSAPVRSPCWPVRSTHRSTCTARDRTAPGCRWCGGTLLLGFTALDQVDALRQAFADSQSAAKRIPERLDPKILSAEIGDEAYLPAISVGFRAVPRCGVSTHTLAPGRLDSWAHRRNCLHIRVGVILFRVLDQQAHASTLSMLTRATTIAAATLPKHS